MILHDPATIGRYRACGAWSDQTVDALFQRTVRERGAEMAIVDAPNRPQIVGGPPRRLTYERYAAFVDDVAARLLKLGVGRDDVVFLQMPNVVELIASIQACARLGAIVSPTPMQYGAHELGKIFRTLGEVRAAITVERFRDAPHARTLRAGLDRMGWSGPLAVFPSGGEAEVAGEGLSSLGQPADEAARAALAQHLAGLQVSGDDVFSICWTSGTTADPKGVPRSHNNWIWHGRAVVEAGNYRDRETILSPFPAVNMGGFGSALLPWWLTGGKLVLHHPFELELFVRQIAEEQVGLTLAAPAVLTTLLNSEALLERYDISCLHDVPSGAAPLSPWMITEFKRRFGIDVINQFGSNEGIGLASSSAEVPDPEERATLFPRIGAGGLRWEPRYTWDTETRLVDVDTGDAIESSGLPGELLIRSPSIFPGYYNRPDLTAEAFTEDRFFRTGDLFEIVDDAEGRPRYYRFIGRARELIVRGGFKISPTEIESLIQPLPAVAEVGVVGVPDARLGERICACVVPKPGRSITLAEIVAAFRDADVAKFKWPEHLELMGELPRNPIGKVVKRDLLANVLAARPVAIAN